MESHVNWILFLWAELRTVSFNMDLNTLDLRTFVFSVSANADHCLQIALGSAPLGGSRFWLPLFVSTPLSTGYEAAQHANMWHFACFTDLDALFLLLVFCKCPLHRSPPFHWLYLLFICNQHSVLFCNHWSALKTWPKCFNELGQSDSQASTILHYWLCQRSFASLIA